MSDTPNTTTYLDVLEQMAYKAGHAAGVADERERCAKVCEARAKVHNIEAEKNKVWEQMGESVFGHLAEEAEDCAAAIREEPAA